MGGRAGRARAHARTCNGELASAGGTSCLRPTTDAKMWPWNRYVPRPAFHDPAGASRSPGITNPSATDDDEWSIGSDIAPTPRCKMTPRCPSVRRAPGAGDTLGDCYCMRSFLSAELLHGLHRDAGRVKKCGVVIHHLKCGVAIRHQRRGVWRGGLLRPAGGRGRRSNSVLELTKQFIRHEPRS